MFDGIEAVHAKVAGSSPDRPSLRRLAEVLENRELWPEGFVWHYGRCPTCAIGLAERLWSGKGFASMCTMLDSVDKTLFSNIFVQVRHHNFWGLDSRLSSVTPKDVARQIRKVLASHPDVS